MSGLYFAYGSNLKRDRMRERVPSARATEAARLDGRRLALDKAGRDGTGKANLAHAPESHVWGVVYQIDPAHWPHLDAYERGYERIAVEVVRRDGSSITAETYVALELTDSGASEWYVRLIVEGAREHELPPEWLAFLEALIG